MWSEHISQINAFLPQIDLVAVLLQQQISKLGHAVYPKYQIIIIQKLPCGFWAQSSENPFSHTNSYRKSQGQNLELRAWQTTKALKTWDIVFSTPAFPHPIHFTKEKTDPKGKAIQRIPCLVQFPERRANSGGIDWVAVSDHSATDQALLRRNATLVEAQKRSSALFAKACLIQVMSAQLSNRANMWLQCV